MIQQLWRFVARSIVAGASAGLVCGWLIFFVFGFLGLSGRDLSARARNGVLAALDLGTSTGIVTGVGIAALLALLSGVWILLIGVPADRYRRWLAGAAALIVIAGNLPTMRAMGWDPIGVVTVTTMASLVTAAVWVMSPWVLSPLQNGGENHTLR